jgi:hypothetical protein
MDTLNWRFVLYTWTTQNFIIFFLNFKISPCFEYCMYSFGYFPGVRLWFADVSKPSVSSIFKGWVWSTPRPAFEDGTDGMFRNVGKSQSDTGEIPKRIHTTPFFLKLNWTNFFNFADPYSEKYLNVSSEPFVNVHCGFDILSILSGVCFMWIVG